MDGHGLNMFEAAYCNQPLEGLTLDAESGCISGIPEAQCGAQLAQKQIG